jgi:hypothetical protein
MRKLTSSFILIGATGFAAWAPAAGVHLEKRPLAVDQGATLNVTGALVGLPAGEVTVKLQASGLATVACVLPGSGEMPGRERIKRVPVTVHGEQRIPAADPLGGATLFSITTHELSFTAAREARCPDERATPEARDVVFRLVTIRVVDDADRVVLRRTMTL